MVGNGVEYRWFFFSTLIFLFSDWSFTVPFAFVSCLCMVTPFFLFSFFFLFHPFFFSFPFLFFLFLSFFLFYLLCVEFLGASRHWKWGNTTLKGRRNTYCFVRLLVLGLLLLISFRLPRNIRSLGNVLWMLLLNLRTGMRDNLFHFASHRKYLPTYLHKNNSYGVRDDSSPSDPCLNCSPHGVLRRPFLFSFRCMQLHLDSRAAT